MARLYIFIASITLSLALSGCGIASGDGPLFKSGGLSDRVGNFATVRYPKRNGSDTQFEGRQQSGGFTPLKRRLADRSGSGDESNSDDSGYGYGSFRGDDDDHKGKKKHRRKHRNKNGDDDNPLFGQNYEGNGRSPAEFGVDRDGERGGYDQIKLPDSGTTGSARVNYSDVLDAQSRQAQNVNLTVTAYVFKLLPDDRRGSPHERFLIQLPNGSTVLVAHNINLAPYVQLNEGDVVTISGEYVWNQKGGVIHYTHRPTNVRHKGGFIEFSGKRYD